MGILWILFGIILMIAGVVCTILIVIAAFQDEVWKGLVSLLCGLYFLYYSFFEYDSEYKWEIALTAYAGWGAGIFCILQGLPADTVAPAGG